MKVEPHTSTALLICHPMTTCPAVQAIAVRVDCSQAENIALSYTLTGACHGLRIPAARPQARVDGLWQHTCFEMFLSPKDDTVYWELNFSPSSEWAMYQFRRYRERVAGGEMIVPPTIVTQQAADHLTVNVRLYLPQPLSTQPVRMGLAAVIEDDRGRLSYWALQHPSEKPDFHHANAFVLEILPKTMVTVGKERQ